MDYNINGLLPIQRGENKKNAWEEVEKRIGLIFPKDYKLFIDSYGEGLMSFYGYYLRLVKMKI